MVLSIGGYKMVTWNQLIRDKMVESKISQEKLGESIGKTQGAIGHWLRGTREPSVEDITKIMLAVGINEMIIKSNGEASLIGSDFEYAGTIKSGTVTVRGEATIDRNGDIIMIKEDFGGKLKIYSDDPDCYALKINGDSLYPRINSGEFIILEPNSNPREGDEVLVELINGIQMIRKLEYHRNGQYRFFSISHPITPSTIDEQNVVKVVFISSIVKNSRYVKL